MSNIDYKCSATYYDQQVYAYYVCPFYQSACGSSDKLTYANIGSSDKIGLTIPAGQACFYEVTATCGAPAFSPASVDSNMIISYAELVKITAYASTAVVSGVAPNSPDAQASPPAAGYPPR